MNFVYDRDIEQQDIISIPYVQTEEKKTYLGTKFFSKHHHLYLIGLIKEFRARPTVASPPLKGRSDNRTEISWGSNISYISYIIYTSFHTSFISFIINDSCYDTSASSAT